MKPKTKAGARSIVLRLWTSIRRCGVLFALLSSSCPLPTVTTFFPPAPRLDDMPSSNIFRLFALIATAAVQVTAIQYNVTVGGSAGLVFTPEFVVSDVQCSAHSPG